LHARFPRQPEDHFRGGHGVRINPVHVGKRTSADMMVDADQKPVLQPLEPRAVNAVALQNNRRIVTAHNLARLHHLVGERQRTVNARDAVVQYNVGVLAHGAQHLAAGQRRSYGVAVRTGVRRQHESLMLSNLPQHVRKHVAMPFFHRIPCGPCFSFSSSRALAVLPPAPFPAPRGPAGNTIPERASDVIAPPVRAGCIPAPLPNPPCSDPHPGRRLPHSPTPAPTVRRRQYEPPSRSPAQSADRPTRLRPAFQSPRAEPHRPARDDISVHASPRPATSGKTNEDIRKLSPGVGSVVLLSRRESGPCKYRGNEVI